MSSNLISALSAGMFSMAMGLMLMHDTKSPLSFGLAIIISPLVNVLFLIPVGNLVDKYRHKNILMFSILTRLVFLLIFALSINLVSGIYKLIPVAIFVLVDSISNSFSTTAYSASVHELVNDRNIQKLSSLTQSASALSSVLAPMLGVALYALTGFNAFIFIEIIATAISFLILLTMHFYYESNNATPDIKTNTLSTQFSNFKNGVAYMKKRHLIRDIIIMAVVINFLFTAVTIGMPFMIINRLHAGNSPIGYIETGFSVGLLIGGLLMTILPSKKHFSLKLFLPLSIMGICMVLLGFLVYLFHDPLRIGLYGFLIMTLSGFMNAILNISINVRLQSTVPTHILGRVMATLTTAVSSIMPIGTLFYTFLFQSTLNGTYIFIANGIILLLYVFSFYPLIYRDVRGDNKDWGETTTPA
ncbi:MULTISPECIES: MFS transporter [unclassified Sporolactobacillus]|uniref:MFS transporter n=1 Tax=unclassified Sporolactobacillus TaxID=2628533 RepID=UPI002367E620|nr:MFS transporter [Sporolactobacillus sp. CQH2019]MDD9149811.1 MFS transporter [Sporolactobacillus sp. CQH2019]